eukprot:3568979-Pleurochrysis_carterae.AAC.1
MAHPGSARFTRSLEIYLDIGHRNRVRAHQVYHNQELRFPGCRNRDSTCTRRVSSPYIIALE